MITLHSGPYHGRRIKDLGKVVIRMSIASAWRGNRPVPGARSGLACYEPSHDRKTAHWSHNEWLGTVIETIET